MQIASLVSPTVTMKLGDSGPNVAAMQLALRQIGYSLKGTGYFGTATDTAVEAFQRRLGLKVDGEVGPATAKMIDASQGIPKAASVVEEIARPLWLEAGIKLIGVHEGVGAKDNPDIIDWAKEEGGDIAKEYTHDSVPWCALFANHCLSSVGVKGTGTLWALDFAGNWPAVKLIGPAVGAFAPMLRSGGGHIIQIVGRDQHGNIMGLGGNQSDQVSIVPFPVSRLNKGFWWPKGVTLPSKIGFSSLPVVSSGGKVSANEA
jgi:uncharacterized protein (TIGR02594 family)